MTKKTLSLVSREFVGFEKSFQLQADHFAAIHPEMQVNRTFWEIHTLYDRMVTEQKVFSADHDLFLCVTDWLPELIKMKGLVPLNTYLENDPPEDWPNGWASSMKQLQTDQDGTIYGIAYHDGPEMFLYREDLFNDPNEQEAFAGKYGYPLQVPSTWSQFLDVAKFFTRPDQDLYGCVLAGYPDGHNNVYDFLIHLWSRGGELVDQNWNPSFNSTIGKEALQYLVNLYTTENVLPPHAREMDSVATGHYFAKGHAAMMWNWCGFAAMAEIPELSNIVGKTKTTVIPRGDNPEARHMSLNIYWVLTIPEGSKNKDAAYQFIKETASKSMDKITSQCGGNGTRLSTWRDPEIIESFPYYSMIEEVHKNVNSPLPIPEYPAINELLSTMVDDAINGRESIDRALVKAEQAIREILQKSGYIRPASVGGEE
ncbi:extracellular solute-binding protein [Cytobacillus purgationiresistens]|uniref:Multiple sugar transport system substrate-binding protein n=1 Tax=Cytobacillus purgationiresistens TaxID=863449 RepID=A0ABU0APP9_9BACI|nr:extracellular solute-binding protein [Cytobacillus purgationiresistens]MDQ0272358.1 multiple sugar transport system substrate-binding protein [Cytobacillus purgationiresistens]